MPRPDDSEFYRYTTRPQQPQRPQQPRQQMDYRFNLNNQPDTPKKFPDLRLDNSLRDFVHQMLGPDAAAAFDKPNKQYRNMLARGNAPDSAREANMLFNNGMSKNFAAQRAIEPRFNALASMVDPSIYRDAPMADDSW